MHFSQNDKDTVLESLHNENSDCTDQVRSGIEAATERAGEARGREKVQDSEYQEEKKNPDLELSQQSPRRHAGGRQG